ncbi:hypothetical protein ACWGQ5_56740, partial [Streptomyces sp. NPDC055722]
GLRATARTSVSYHDARRITQQTGVYFSGGSPEFRAVVLQQRTYAEQIGPASHLAVRGWR